MPNPAPITRGHSCLSCYQRKVKCDGKRPCSRCLKSGKQCQSERPSRPHPRPISEQVDILVERLRRYERLLSFHKIPLDEVPPDGEDQMMEDALVPPPAGDTNRGRIIVQDGHPRFVDNALWRGLGAELPNPNDLLEHSDDSKSDTRTPLYPAEQMLLGRQPGIDLEGSHPSVFQIMMLWQTFLDNFNPLVKILHAPSVQNTISNAVTNLHAIPSSTEALMFAVYFAAITTLSESDCLRIVLETKSVALFRYADFAQQALANARFLRSTDLVVLQATVLYLLASRPRIDPQSMWILSGAAQRLGQTMGLHREQSLEAFSPFEAEIRRRVWWQIVILDGRAAQLSGAMPSPASEKSWDTRRPLNLNDSDLYPTMMVLPTEHRGITEMLFCMLRYEIGQCMGEQGLFETDTGKTPSQAPTIPQKRAAVDNVEQRLEPILEKCDKSIPLHRLGLLMAKSAFCQIRLSVSEPLRPMKRTTEECDLLFNLGLEILSCDSISYSSSSLRPFLWHISEQFPYEAFIFVLSTLSTNGRVDKVEEAWTCVSQVYENHPGLFTDLKNPLHAAMGRLALRAWDKRVEGLNRATGSSFSTLPAIEQLRSQLEGTPSVSTDDPRPGQSNLADTGFGTSEFSSFLDVMDDPQLDDWQALLQNQGSYMTDEF